MGSCYGSSCAFSSFYAYHSAFGSGSSTTIYTNQPYAAYAQRACDSGQHPNGDDADATINVVSHEHNESITDPLGNGWFDMQGYENGDKCAWNFGTTLDRTSYVSYKPGHRLGQVLRAAGVVERPSRLRPPRYLS